MKKLTSLIIQNLKTPGVHTDYDGLRLRVTKSGTKQWIFRYRWYGKTKDMGLGSFPEISLAEARKKRDQNKHLILKNIDPILEKNTIKIDRIKKESMTFKIAASEYIETHKVQWTNKKHAKQWTSTLEKYVYPKIGKLPVYHITNNHILNILKPIWGVKHETASRVRQRIEKILSWSIALKYRDLPNPASLNDNLVYLLPKSSTIRKVKHHRSLPYEKLPHFINELKKSNSLSGMSLLFLILTASRTSEVIGAKWNEFNLDFNVWNIPEDRIKTRIAHTVTLNKSSIDLLEKIKPFSDEVYVFPGSKPKTHISNNAMLQFLKENHSEIHTQSVVHGFRSSFRDWAEEQHNFSRRAIELCLSHQNDNKTESAYLRTNLLNKRHHIMKEWDLFLNGNFIEAAQIKSIKM